MHIPETGFAVIYILLLEKPVCTMLHIFILNLRRWTEQGNSRHPAQSPRSPDTTKIRRSRRPPMENFKESLAQGVSHFPLPNISAYFLLFPFMNMWVQNLASQLIWSLPNVNIGCPPFPVSVNLALVFGLSLPKILSLTFPFSHFLLVLYYPLFSKFPMKSSWQHQQTAL